MSNQKGFTLIELIMVVAVLTVIISFAVPKITGYIDMNEEKYRKNQEYIVNKALTQYYALTGKYYKSTCATGDPIINSDVMLTELNNKTGSLIDNSAGIYQYIKDDGSDDPDPNKRYVSKVKVLLNP